MPVVHFKGQILPVCHSLTLDPRIVKWDSPNIGLTATFKLFLIGSAVNVQCDINRFEDGDLLQLYRQALDLVRASVNLAAFAVGTGMTVYLSLFIDPDGKETILSMEDKRLPPLCTAFGINSTDPEICATFEKVCTMVISELALSMALDDLIVAITLPHCAPVNCCRAVDGLRKLIGPSLTTKQQYEVFKANLRLTKDYLHLITDTATGPRHGDRSYIPGNITNEITKRSWVIMNRFIEFRKRGSQPLPENEFPLL